MRTQKWQRYRAQTSNGTKYPWCLKCVDALRLDIFMSYQSMFVAIILFFVFNEQTEPWRGCRITEQEVRYVSLFVFYFWHTKFDGRNLEKERYMWKMLATRNGAIALHLLNIVLRQHRHNKLNLHMDLDFFIAYLMYATTQPLERALFLCWDPFVWASWLLLFAILLAAFYLGRQCSQQ